MIIINSTNKKYIKLIIGIGEYTMKTYSINDSGLIVFFIKSCCSDSKPKIE